MVVIGGSAGIGLETARLARAEGADVVLTGRNEERLRDAADALGASGTATFDANDSSALQAFFDSLEEPVDHVMVTAGGRTTPAWPTWTSTRRGGPSRSTRC